jgi:hypothetical protein
MSYSVWFSFHTFFSVSCHISCPTMWVSPFLRFSFSHQTSGPTVCVSHFTRFSVFLAIFLVILCEFLLFLICQFSLHIPDITVCYFQFSNFQCFSPYSRSFSVLSHFPYFSIFSPHSRSYSVHFSVFLAIFQVIHCFCLISHFFHFCPQNFGPTVYISHTSHFSLFPHSKSYSVSVSFSTFFSLFATIQFLQCVFLIFKVFHCFLP